jgi:xylulokinase
MFLGIDLGTSAVKAIVIDAAGRVVQEASAPLTRATPRPAWSEQQPEDWWTATIACVHALPADVRAAVRGIGLAGQMHGAVLLDARQNVLRPAILWNDGRAAQACRTFEQREPQSREISGNLAMPGFTAPKLVWVEEHEPDVFARLATVLLPKDWLRLRLTGEHVSEASDASGTLWLDLRSRAWSPRLLAASGLSQAAVPRLVESGTVGGMLAHAAAQALGLRSGIAVAGGGSDNACGAAGIGVVDDADALLSLGTSGVILVADARVRTAPALGVHAFCHCVPERWLRMSVMLSCTATLTAAARLCGVADAAALVEQAGSNTAAHPARLVMLPYLDGERTPHNDPTACGVLFGLDAGCTRGDVARAALEGVAFALADGLAALEASGPPVASLTVIGGGSRSPYWARILAAALGRPLAYLRHGDNGPALGAARLARVAVDGVAPAEAFTRPPVARAVEPDPVLAAELRPRRSLFGALYRDLAPRFAASAGDNAS